MKRALASLILASLLMTTLPLNVSADDTEDIPTNAAATGFHDSLVAALVHADLVTTLQGTGPFTVRLMDIQPGWALFFGGTSLLIMVGVAIDTMQQVNSYLLNKHYDGLMKTGKNRKAVQ